MTRLVKHRNGVFYTPAELATYLLSHCPDGKPRRVLDPACGEFSLLMAASKKYGLSNEQLVGCDKRRIRKNNYSGEYCCKDFFKFEDKEEFDLIVTNPPYVKGDRCPKSCRVWYAGRKLEGFTLSKRADIWVYFILKCLDHLADSGTLAAILPWSFFQTDYSLEVRRYLAAHFKRIDVQVLTTAHFSDTPQKVVLLWMVGKGDSRTEVRYCCSDNLSGDALRFVKIKNEQWLDACSLRGVKPQSAKVSGVSTFGAYCDVKIGLVPGATKFFVRTKDQLTDIKIKPCECVKIITQCKSISAFDVSRIPVDGVRYALKITAKNVDRYRELIADAEAVDYHKRSHCKNRKNWYSLDFPERVPDAFFTYRASSVPLMTLNDAAVDCTNSVHRIFLRDNDLSIDKRRWLQISMLSAYSLFDFELKARTYGKNVLKIEPTALRNVRVYCPDTPVRREKVEEIAGLIEQGNKEAAVVVATAYVFDTMKLSKAKRIRIVDGYNRLRVQRMGAGNEIDFGLET